MAFLVGRRNVLVECGETLRGGELKSSGNMFRRDPPLSLGLKCDELAVPSFAALVDELEDGPDAQTPQELGGRQYLSRHSQFRAESRRECGRRLTIWAGEWFGFRRSAGPRRFV